MGSTCIHEGYRSTARETLALAHANIGLSPTTSVLSGAEGVREPSRSTLRTHTSFLIAASTTGSAPRKRLSSTLVCVTLITSVLMPIGEMCARAMHLTCVSSKNKEAKAGVVRGSLSLAPRPLAVFSIGKAARAFSCCSWWGLSTWAELVMRPSKFVRRPTLVPSMDRRTQPTRAGYRTLPHSTRPI